MITILLVGDSIVNYSRRCDMESSSLSLADIQEVPRESLILLTGPPGAGKSTFCHRVARKSMANYKPVIFVTSEQRPTEFVDMLRESSIEEPAGLSFVDAFSETVGLACTQRPDTVCANCADLNSLSIAITKQQERMGTKGTLLVFDSLTSPYLFSGVEVVKFVRLFLSKFAAEGNSVFALVDEGCGKEEDMVAMQSIADGILRMEIKESSRVINVVKYPKLQPTTIEVPPAGIEDKKILDMKGRSREYVEESAMMLRGRTTQVLKREIGNYMNFFWANFAFWSSALWYPEGFSEMTYEMNKKHAAGARQTLSLLPWYWKLLLKFYIPKSFNNVRNMKKLLRIGREWEHYRCGILEYLEDISRTGEYYFRVYENFECCGFENIGATMASSLPPFAAGICKGLEQVEQEWNAVETKCIGLGDPYCEFKVVPGEIDELKSSLQKDALVVEGIYERLIQRVMGFLLHGEPLLDRPKLGSDIHVGMATSVTALPALSGNRRYQMAWRMGGVKSGMEVGKRLLESGLSGDEAIKRVIDFMNYCKVGKVTVDERIKIVENCESFWSKVYIVKWEEPQCLFTTGFLNGLFSVVKNQHVKEIKCIATGDPYCEWEII
jgi:predicted hydrocarbon binding protein/KaiC/GvpD/RAD55 family RecA-like ATPase